MARNTARILLEVVFMVVSLSFLVNSKKCAQVVTESGYLIS
jgi:hypothetical protein